MAPGPKMVSHDAGFRDVNASNGVRHEIMITLRALVNGDEAVIQAHIVGQCIHCARADDMAAAEAWAAGDPYAKAGLFASVELTAWKKVIG